MNADENDFEVWLRNELHFTASALRKSISATHLVRRRPSFAQTIRPKPGSVVASPEFADYNPEPDYFFHWLRDSALVMDAVRRLMGNEIADLDGHRLFSDFVHFSLGLSDFDAGAALPDEAKVAPQVRQYLRPRSEMLAVRGHCLLAEARFNPDGTLDILKWARPQFDGPALRALTLMRYWPIASMEESKSELEQLIRQDLAFTHQHSTEPSFDIWEEELGHHYYTRLVQLGALFHGANWLRSIGSAGEARGCDDRATELRALLDQHWRHDRGIYIKNAERADAADDRDPDISIILGVLHAALSDGTHSVRDPKAQATLARLEEVFSSRFDINRRLRSGSAPALGRYPGDCYFGGGAYYLSTLAAAEFRYRLAISLDAAARAQRKSALIAQGDGVLGTVRRFTPRSGALSEQFDQSTGAQRSARNLAWSYAAFLTACRARERAKSEY